MSRVDVALTFRHDWVFRLGPSRPAADAAVNDQWWWWWRWWCYGLDVALLLLYTRHKYLPSVVCSAATVLSSSMYTSCTSSTITNQNHRKFEFWTSVTQETQQVWHTSAVAIHLVIARLLSMSIIFCQLPTSNIRCDFKQQQWFRYSLYSIQSFYRPQWTADVRAVNTVLLFDAHFSGNANM